MAPTEKKVGGHTEARLRLQLPGGKTVMRTVGAETTLFEVLEGVRGELGEGVEVQSLESNFPRKVWKGGVDFGLTVKEAGLVPSAALIVK